MTCSDDNWDAIRVREVSEDSVLVTQTFDDHLIWLRHVLSKIRGAGLTINKEKSEFCRTQVRYLGFVINCDGLQVDPDKVVPVVNYPACATS